MLGAAVMLLVIATAGCNKKETTGESGGARGDLLPANSVGVVDPATSEIVARIPVGSKPLDLAFADGAVWVANVDDDSVTKIDASTRQVVATTKLGISPTGLAAGEGAVWATNGLAGVLLRIDPETAKVVERVRLRPKVTINLFKNIANHLVSGPSSMPLTAGAGRVWVSDLNTSRILAFDPTRHRVVDELKGYGAQSLAIAREGLWVDDYPVRTLWLVDPASGTVLKRIRLRPATAAPKAFAPGPDSVWVANTGPSPGVVPGDAPNFVWRVDPGTGTTKAKVEVGYLPDAVAVGDDFVWVGTWGDHSLVKIDPATNEVSAKLDLGRNIGGALVAGGAVWVTAQ